MTGCTLSVLGVIRAELTEPYAALLADDLTEGVLAEAEALKAQAAQKERASEDNPAS